jgi:hypothetical protein
MVPWKPHPSAPTIEIPDDRALRHGRATGLYVDEWYWLAGDLQSGLGQWQEFSAYDARVLTRDFWGNSQGKHAGVICELGPQGHKYTVCAAKASDAVTVLNDDAITRGLAKCKRGAQAIAGFDMDFWSQSDDCSDGNSSDRSSRSSSSKPSSRRSSLLSKESDSATCSTQVTEAKRASDGSLNGEALLFYQVRSEHMGLMPEFEAQLASNHGAWTREEPRRRPIKMVPWKPHPSAPKVSIPSDRELRHGRATGVYVDRWYWLAGDLQNGFGPWQEFNFDDAKLLTRAFSQGKNAGVICEVGPQGHKYTVCAAKPSDAVTVLNDDAIARGLAICEKGAQTIAGFALDVWSQAEDYSDGKISGRSRARSSLSIAAGSTRSSLLSTTGSSSTGSRRQSTCSTASSG